MRSSEKKVLLITVLIGVVIIVGLLLWRNKGDNSQNKGEIQNLSDGQYTQQLQDGGKVNISQELKKTKKLDELEITNIQLKEIGGITNLLADVQNKSEKQVESKKVKVEILNKSGEVITTLKGRIDSIPAGGKVQLNMAVTADVANAYDFKISKF